MRILNPSDFAVFVILLLFIYPAFIAIRNSRYANSPIQKYFIPALTFRIIGGFLTALMYQYYYGYGDTFYYYIASKDITNVFYSDPILGFEMLFTSPQNWSIDALQHLTFKSFFLRDAASGLTAKIGGFIGVFTGGSYMGMSVGITTFAFLGCWRMYRVFQDLYPHLFQELAFAVLFVPSVCFWGTGLMKDPLCIGAIGFFLHGLYFFFIKRQRFLSSFFWIIVGSYLMLTLKTYIFLAILPSSIVWLFLHFRSLIANSAIRTVSGPAFLGIGLVGGFFALQQIGASFEKYALENILMEAAKTQWWLALSTERDGGTGYDLGVFDPSVGGLLTMFPKAVNVTLFRPYIWEARKIIVLPSAAEAIFSLGFTVYVLFKVRFFRLFRTIIEQPIVLFCLIFSLIFAFAVGFTSLNFGALARYKIPCLPFYFAALVIIYDQGYRQPLAKSLSTH